MIQEFVNIGGKTTMRIGGQAHFYAELETKDDVEAAWAFAMEHDVPMIPLGGGSNTVFADGVVEALVVRIKNESMAVEGNDPSTGSGQAVRVAGGKNLVTLINELAAKNLDLSPLTGILGTVGGAIFGNAGQGPTGIWIGKYVKEVSVFWENEWRVLSKEDCDFSYRESVFKHGPDAHPLIWEVLLTVPTREKKDIEADIQMLLKKRLETQPHVKTAGSCFKAVGETPAWRLIDAANLRGHTVGDVQIAEKHANFLLNTGKATFEDASALVRDVKQKVGHDLEVEMRFIGNDGSLVF
jgi:UDP-N-acetylmuramate dehydrogenase